ncbi:MAG: metal ABC transporter permease, partial [Propionibacteriaceae bacterium]|nr:metal ABC transporter permease [Propionibacteriaceae bacterium]
LMVVPAAAAGNLVRGFTLALFTAMGIGVLTAVGGTVGAFYLDTAPGALIVLLAIVVFALSWPVSALKDRQSRAAADAAGDPAPLGVTS